MKTIYWISTMLISTYLFWSSYTYLLSKATIDGVRALGFPDHFRIQLAVLKILAALILLIPQVPLQVKEWAYAGVGLFIVTALVAHIAHKDHFALHLVNLVLLSMLIVSNIYLHKTLS